MNRDYHTISSIDHNTCPKTGKTELICQWFLLRNLVIPKAPSRCCSASWPSMSLAWRSKSDGKTKHQTLNISYLPCIRIICNHMNLDPSLQSKISSQYHNIILYQDCSFSSFVTNSYDSNLLAWHTSSHLFGIPSIFHLTVRLVAVEMKEIVIVASSTLKGVCYKLFVHHCLIASYCV